MNLMLGMYVQMVNLQKGDGMDHHVGICSQGLIRGLIICLKVLMLVDHPLPWNNKMVLKKKKKIMDIE